MSLIEDPAEFVKAHHPVTGGQTEFTRIALAEVWSELGWVEGWPTEVDADTPAVLSPNEVAALEAKANELKVAPRPPGVKED